MPCMTHEHRTYLWHFFRLYSLTFDAREGRIHSISSKVKVHTNKRLPLYLRLRAFNWAIGRKVEFYCGSGLSHWIGFLSPLYSFFLSVHTHTSTSCYGLDLHNVSLFLRSFLRHTINPSTSSPSLGLKAQFSIASRYVPATRPTD